MTPPRIGGRGNPSDIFAVQLGALNLVTMWPTFSENVFYTSLNKTIYWINVVILAICTIALFAKAILTDDLVDRSEAMDIFTLTGSALYKMVFFYNHHEEMKDMFECGLQLISRLPDKWAQYVGKFSVLHCSLGFICITFWGLCPLFKWVFGETSLGEMKLPINVYDPFASEGFLFSFFYLVCYYGLVSSAHIYMAADCFLFTSIHVANGSLETLNKMLVDMAVEKKDEIQFMDVTHERLKECVKLHTHTLRYIRKTDKLFRSMILADVLHAIISLSFAMLQATESKGIFEIVKMVVFVAYCFVHQYLNSYFGQHLIDQQERIYKQLILQVHWADGTANMKTTYRLAIMGFRQPVKLSAWSVYNLQYETFLEFVKSMISYFMVLIQLKDESRGGIVI
ncbi:Odorant receptor [Nesidiocoris tenuis]|uniref:Odorant receptor n=1 Tax=Nesidiocoris tenuis TaxID=355587 RepID=A0ABN7AKH0_9HEMI|nr:Odorant receptor [Nesidiocoris tenuis]